MGIEIWAQLTVDAANHSRAHHLRSVIKAESYCRYTRATAIVIVGRINQMQYETVGGLIPTVWRKRTSPIRHTITACEERSTQRDRSW